jgi:hypothetical protein
VDSMEGAFRKFSCPGMNGITEHLKVCSVWWRIIFLSQLMMEIPTVFKPFSLYIIWVISATWRLLRLHFSPIIAMELHIRG